MGDPKKIMIVAGEASGDTHAAKLVRELRLSVSEGKVEFFGAAGPKMVGLLEIGRALTMFLKAFRDLKNAALQGKPDVVILVDFPDFNLKLAKSLKRKGFKVVYYISPQLWAWRSYRVRSIKQYVDLMITILPFEKAWYAGQGVDNVDYVGSPLVREIHTDLSKEDFCKKHGLDPTAPIVSLLPGSRHKEIVRNLPIMLAAASRLDGNQPAIQFVIALASTRNEHEVEDAVAALKAKWIYPPKLLTLVEGETYDALNASDAAAITSGTATLEAAVIGTPMAIVYKTSAINYKLLRPLISVDHFGLVNLIAEKRIATELIQDQFTPESLSAELKRLLKPSENAVVRQELSEATEKLGHGGASKRAAEAILRLIDQT
jgi:lipid-A-disaccharide synthase